MLFSASAADAADDDEVGPADEGDDDDEEFPTDAQLALALRAKYARHRHDITLTRRTLTQKTETELGGAVDLSTRRRVIKTTIALIRLEEAETEEAEAEEAEAEAVKAEVAEAEAAEAEAAEAEAARGCHADDKPTTPDFDDGVCDDFAEDVATGLGVPRDGVSVAGAGARAGSVTVETNVIVHGGAEAAAAFASPPTDPAKALVDEFRFGPCAVSGMSKLAAFSAAVSPRRAPEGTAAGGRGRSVGKLAQFIADKPTAAASRPSVRASVLETVRVEEPAAAAVAPAELSTAVSPR